MLKTRYAFKWYKWYVNLILKFACLTNCNKICGDLLVKIYWADEKSSGWKVLVEDDHSITEQIQTVF